MKTCSVISVSLLQSRLMRVVLLSFGLLVAGLNYACSEKIPIQEIPPKEENKDDNKDPDRPSKVEISLFSNDASNTVKYVTVNNDETMIEPAWIPDTKKGYTFAGWYKDAECEEAFDFDNEVVTEAISLYAGWSRDIVLTDKGKVARVTGASLNGENLKNPNNTDKRWNLGGTDLGIIWEIEEGKYGLFFGDSYGSDFQPVGGGGPGGASDWRSNVLAFTENTDLDNGIVFSDMLTDAMNPSRAIPVIERPNYYAFTPIPTAAISLNGVQYMHYMYWEVFSTAHYTDTYSSIYRSVDGGKHWASCRGKISFDYTSWFGMVGLAKRDGDPYCYMLGTQTGVGYRKQTARVARFLYDDILDKDKYEFWSGHKRQWIQGDETAATDVLDGTVGELSVVWMEKYGRWLTLYFDQNKYAVCYRSAARMNGPWSKERVLCSGTDARYSQLYGSFIHPLSAKKDAEALYYTMSQWVPYNVFLMKASVEYAPE